MPEWKTCLIACIAATVVSSGAIAAESVYTDFPMQNSRCKPVHPATAAVDADMGSVSEYCPGYKGYRVLYKEGDARVSVHYGHLSAQVVEHYWESFGPFNSVAEKIEWRLDDAGVPRAAIQRFYLGNIDEAAGMPTEARKGQVLVVSKVGQPDDNSGCVVGLVDALANPDANALARQVADTVVAGFACGRDAAVYHGARGDKSADLSATFGEQ
jgi:hypothetical protein